MADRGIIVADACSLGRLQAGIRQDFYEDGVSAGKPVRRYLDLLPFLGEQGFRVVVPEMVSMEMGGVLTGAPNINDLFSDSRRNQDSTDTGQAIRTFLERAKAGKVAGVEIRPSSPATDHGRYLDSLREIAAEPSLTRKRKCDLLALAQKKDRRHYGERACLDAIGELLDTHGGPVFFLSDDRDALKECHERFGDRVGRLNAKGFLGGFTRTGLFEGLQIKPGLVHVMSHDLLQQNGHPLNGQSSAGAALIDNSRAPHEGNDHRFQREMEALAAGLALDSVNGTPNGRETARAPAASRSDEFRRKWGWTGRVRAPRVMPADELASVPDTIEAPVNGAGIINVQFERNYFMKSETPTSGTADTAYETYKQSFGFQVSDRRRERKMTQEGLAAEVERVLDQGGAVDKARIIRWEQALEVPDRDQFKALERLLIDENRAIRPEDKDEARETFALAYERSKVLIDRNSHGPETQMRRFAFGTLLREHHDQLTDVSLEGLANKINERLKLGVEDRERELLAGEPHAFIAAIEAGVVQPSKGLAVALVAALDKIRELGEDEKRTLYEAYEAGGGPTLASRSRPSEDRARPPRRRPADDGTELSPDASRIRSELVDFFRGEGGKPDVTAIASYARKDLGYGHGAASVVYPIMDESNQSAFRLRKVLSDTAKDILSAYLAEQGKPKDAIERFEAKFDELRKATGHRTRHRSEGGVSVA